MVSFTLHYQLHPIKSLLFCYIVSFYIFSINIRAHSINIFSFLTGVFHSKWLRVSSVCNQ